MRAFGSDGFRRGAALAALAALLAIAAPAAAFEPATPLEAAGYGEIPKSPQVNAFLQNLADGSPLAALAEVGRSALDRPILALSVSRDGAFLKWRRPDPGRLTVMLVGGQHGPEPSGGEALQAFARDLAAGPSRRYLDTMNFVIVPLANPDGRDLWQRVNGQGVNISTDFVMQSQPETRTITRMLADFSPHVVLDVHESSILKERSLGAQGFMTDFEAQFEISNNPNIHAPLRAFVLDDLLPKVLAAVGDQGLRATRYLNEVTDINQVLTHGGATMRNLRNLGGFRGMVSVLLENRLDPPGTYPTPRNIQARVAKQLTAISGFLDVVAARRAAIRAAVDDARGHVARQPGSSEVVLNFRYVAPAAGVSTLDLPLTDLRTGAKAAWRFAYAPGVEATVAEPLPSFYAVRREQERIAAVLLRHGIAVSTLYAPRTVTARVLTIDQARRRPRGPGRVGTVLEVAASAAVAEVTLQAGDLWIDLSQPHGALVPQILDPRSANSIFHDPAFTGLLVEGKAHFGLAVP